MNDLVQKKIVVTGQAPRVTSALIDSLVESLEYHTHLVPGTTTIVATSILPFGHTVATELSACTSPENFNPAIGIEQARNKCRDASRRELWNLEAYRLKASMQEERATVAGKHLGAIRALLAPGDDRSLGELMSEQVSEFDPSIQVEINAHAKRVREMIEGYSDAELIGLLIAVAESPRLGVCGSAPACLKG